MRKHIENTSRHGVNPKWLLGGNPDAIRHQEQQGQDQLVNSTELPVKGDVGPLEALGVVFGPPKKGDPLFCSATLPSGWSKQPTDHSMWSQLVDENGVAVASVFYKAAFYDRDAFIMITRKG